MMKFGLCYDLRNPKRGGRSRSMADVHAATLEQIEHVDRLGYDDVWFTSRAAASTSSARPKR